jgi:pre-60S factor REI1
MAMKFTCISCRVVFGGPDIQRQHYKTDWHRYNLKRKVAELPPITAEEFQKRVIQQREKDEAETKGNSVFCKVCRKAFASAKAFENHLNSKRHKAGLVSQPEEEDELYEPAKCHEHVLPVNKKEDEAMSEDYDSECDSDIDEVDSDEWDDDTLEISDNNPILHNDCLFCPHHSSTMTKNIKHMMSEHSFFIPDLDFVVNLRGLLLYLGEKVCSFYMCLWCNCSGKGFYSIEAAQQHMRDKGHCKMLHEGDALAEYYMYYNYSKSYPDNEVDVDIDEEVTVPVINDSDYQLTLPSGAKIGHRSLVVYYRYGYFIYIYLKHIKNQLL